MIKSIIKHILQHGEIMGSENHTYKIAKNRAFREEKRMLAINSIIEENTEKSISVVIDIATNPKESENITQFCEDRLLYAGKKILVIINNIQKESRDYMSSVNTGKNKFNREKMLKANDISNLTQRIMSDLNRGIKNKKDLKSWMNINGANNFKKTSDQPRKTAIKR
jgi:hypothetical protein